MKSLFIKLALAIAVSHCIVSCAPIIYQQIATLESDQVKMNDNGVFSSDNPEFSVIYDFWSECGAFIFTVVNNTDKPLYLNLEKSYFIRNGIAFDYFQNRTFVESKGVSGSYSSAGLFSSMFSTSSSVTSNSYITRKSTAVEYAEQQIVCIPAHSSKSFEEFKVSTKTVRECGLPRDPSKKESAEKEYTAADSPISIENRLVFIKDNIDIPVTHKFYVRSVKNIAENDVHDIVYPDKCSGAKSPFSVNVHKMASSNRYYIKYTKDYYDNDRKAEPVTPSKSSKQGGRRF